MSPIQEILSRCIFDWDFLQQLRTTPNIALEGYDINDEVKQTLSDRDHGVLELLGQAHEEMNPARVNQPRAQPRTQQAMAASKPASPPDTHCSLSTTVALAPTRLAVRLVPYISQATTTKQTIETAVDNIAISYSAQVDPLPEGVSMDNLHPPPEQSQLGQAMPLLAVQIDIQAHAYCAPEQATQVRFEINATLPQSSNLAPTSTARSADSDDAANSNNPQQSESEAVRQAVTSVHAASPANRLERVLDLIEVFEAKS